MMISCGRIALAAFSFFICEASLAVSFENDPWTVSVNGFLNMSFLISSCERNLVLADVVRCPSLSDGWGDYAITNNLLPSSVSLQVMKREQHMNVGGFLTLRLPAFNGLTAQDDFTVSRLLARSLIFWDSPTAGRFEIGRNYPIIGREIFFFNGLLADAERNFESLPGHKTHLPRSYAAISYRTPVKDGFSVTTSLGDSVELQKYTSNFSMESYLPNASFNVSYKGKLLHIWFNYFLQSLSYKADSSSFIASVGEIGGIFGPSDSSGDGFSLIMDYQIGDGLGLLSDFIWPIGARLRGLPKMSYLFEGVRYKKDAVRLLAGYSRTNIIYRSQLSDEWMFSVSRQVSSALSVFGQLGISNWPGLIRNQQLRFAGVGFMFLF